MTLNVDSPVTQKETRALWQAHMQAPHLAAYMKATEGAVANFVLNEMSKI
jgi:quinol monooxygenase YgiN